MTPSDEQKQIPIEPESTPPPVQHMFDAPASLRSDQFISANNEQVYAFQHDQKHLSLLQRFGQMTRAKKILVVAGIASAVFVVTVIALSVFMYQSNKSANLAAQKKAVASSNDLNKDGKIDSADTKIAIGDVNGDGVVNDDDIAFAEADVNGDGVIDENDNPDESVPWWQSMLSRVQNETNSNAANSEPTIDDVSSSDSDSISIEDTAEPTLTDDELLAYNDDMLGGVSEAEINDPTEAVQATVAYSGSGTALTLASWNILWWHNAASNAPNGIRAILDKAQVVGLQEVGTDGQKKAIKDMASSSIGVYSPGPHTPIVWNNTLYQKVASGYKGIIKSGIAKYAVYVKLRNRSTGQQFYVFNFHATVGVSDNPGQGCSSKVCDVYKYEMSVLSKYVNSHKSDNIPIFVTGDFNSNYRSKITCQISWLSCATFRNIGLKSGFEYTGLAGIGTTASSIGSSDRLIDYVYSWQRSDVEPISVAIIGPNAACHRDSYGQNHCWNGSDHKPSLFSVKLH